jgi:MtaA/CmuA family methyltransferase
MVPFHPILMHFAARYHGITYREFASDHSALVAANLHCLEAFGHDAVSVISDPVRETAAFGAEVVYPEDGVPHAAGHVVTDWSQAGRIESPDLFANVRTRDRIDGVAGYRHSLGLEFPVIGWVEGPLAEVCDLAGVSETLLQLAMAPAPVRKLMDVCVVTGREFAAAQIEAGADIVGVGDAICSQVSPEMYREFVLPLHRELFEFIHGCGARVKLHICGDITAHLSAVGESGADIVDLDSMVSFTDARRELPSDTICCGNLDPVRVIRDLNADEVEHLTRALIATEHHHPFILSGGCEITADTPHENLHAIRNASRR